MKRHKKALSLFLTFVFLFCFSISTFASQPVLPDNFLSLSVEQRIQWLDENIPQVTENATRINNSISFFTDYADYTSTKQTYYENDLGGRVVGISVKYNWTVTSDFTVESYNVSNFSTYIYDTSYVFIDKDVTAYYLTDSNVKVYPEATFASAYVGILIGQNVNLHGSGSISYSPVTQSLDAESPDLDLGD